MTVNGEFYIDDLNDDFYLRQLNAWNKKGRMVRAHVVGLTSEGPFPFLGSQYFELAISETAERFHSPFSDGRSFVSAVYPSAGSCDLVLTDSLSSFLGSGTNVICTAHFEGVAQKATLTFNDVTVPARTPLWVVMPATADLTLAGIRCLFASEPL